MKTFDNVAKLRLAKLKAGQFVETGGYKEKGGAGGAKYFISATAGGANFDVELANGNWALLEVGSYIWLDKIGLVDNTDPLQNSIVMDAAIKRAEALGGKTIMNTLYDAHFENPIKLRETVYLDSVAGGKEGLNAIRYVGDTFQDFVTSEAGHRNFMGVSNLLITGGNYTKGRARYVVGFDSFNTRCWIKNCVLRDGLGLLRIDSGYYSRIENVQCKFPTPKQDSPDIPFTDNEWGDVHDSAGGAVKLLEMNSAVITKLQCANLIGEATTGAEPYAAAVIDGSNMDIGALSIEATGIPYNTTTETITPAVTILLATTAITTITGLYIELCDVTGQIIRTKGKSRVNVNGFQMYNCKCDTVAYNEGAGDLTLSDGQMWRMDARRIEYTQTGGDVNLGDGSNVNWVRTSYRSGRDDNTIMDAGTTDNDYGTTDGPLRNAEESGEYTDFPKVIGGLNVSLADVSGSPACTVTGGTFLNQSGKHVNGKCVVTGTETSTQILRPSAISSYYRLWVGKAGNMFLTASASPFGDPRGNWLASFESDAGGVLSNLVDNPRLTMTGEYIGGTSQARISQYSGTPPSTDTLRNLDTVDNLTGGSGQPQGWVFPSGSLIARPNYL